jgi:hypothetical protein
MSKSLLLFLSLFLVCGSSFGSVNISSPTNNATVNGAVNFTASANTSCSQGVGSMGIYPAPYQLAYVGGGSNLNHSLSLNSGKYNVVIVAWDRCGGASTAAVTISVTNSGGGNGKSFTNLQHSGGWEGAGQGPPNFVDCSPCSKVAWSSNRESSHPL